MSVYAHPLHVYLKGSTFRDLGEPEEIVHGFFASRLSRSGYLLDWLASSRQLRFWLLTGFRHYLYEQIEAQQRSRRPREPGPSPPPVTAEQAFHRETGLAIVREAYRRAEEACAAARQGEHWRIFREHHLKGHAYAEIAGDLAIDERRAAVMARTAAGKFRRALRELVSWPEASTADVDQELRDLMEAVQR
jgi:DNA-directed RNA polymerase specialized sigma24 family protein